MKTSLDKARRTTNTKLTAGSGWEAGGHLEKVSLRNQFATDCLSATSKAVAEGVQ